MKLYRTAADLGSCDAMDFLGQCYEQGLGVAADKAEAVKWYRKAAVSGGRPAKEALRRLGEGD